MKKLFIIPVVMLCLFSLLITACPADTAKGAGDKTASTATKDSGSVKADPKFTANSTKVVKGAFNAQGIMVVEMESLDLVQATVVDSADASGGKAVKVLSVESAGAINVTLEPGTYLIDTFINAPDGDHDAVYIGLGDDSMRVYPKTWTGWTKTLSMQIKITATSTLPLRFAVKWPDQKKPAESGMLLDRFEITKK